ncbi:hypothetical protein N7537_007291 [Penicillium hordei]|uniref:Uncharacterized protein n=1 Tax=Penicillium hordei TaxID=40994 RepID=A0AAD6DY99_9EURO|nr:uncharacterized protein N7537_007291 [Penicillium hordei]KAJ5597207.1 hypothetical protein N7537_007291 [Penicillium hordei]
MAMTACTDLGKQKATTSSSPTPCYAKFDASWRERESSSEDNGAFCGIFRHPWIEVAEDASDKVLGGKAFAV